MSENPATYSVRIPSPMRRKLEEFAKSEGRSLHAEILLRLGASLDASNCENSSTDNALEERIRQIATEIVEARLASYGLTATPP